MVYVEPPIISTTIEHSKDNESIGNKDKKMERTHKRNFKWVHYILSKLYKINIPIKSKYFNNI